MFPLQVNKMIDDIQDSFTEAVERTTWIDKKTKAAIKEKVTYIKRRIGFPEWILDPDEVEDYYEQVRCKKRIILHHHKYKYEG